MRSGVFDDRDHAEDLAEHRSGSRPGAVIGGHGIDERVGVVQYQCEQAIDAVTSDGDNWRPVGDKVESLPLENRTHCLVLVGDDHTRLGSAPAHRFTAFG